MSDLPPSRHASPGRNDLCWCGSGKKYKKCHLVSDDTRSDAPQPDAPQPAKATDLGGIDEFDGLRRRIGVFLGQVLPERDIKRAHKELFGDEIPDENDAAMSLTDWMVHDLVAPSLRRTVLGEFLVREGPRLTDRERGIAEGWSRSFMGLYEVQSLKPGTGLTVKDLIFGEEVFVHDVSMSNRLARWDVLFARMVTAERGLEFTGTGMGVPRQHLQPLRESLEQDRLRTGLLWREYLKDNWPRIRRRSFEIGDQWVDSIRLTNTDGEELLFCKAVYTVTDNAAVMDVLQRCPEFAEEEGSDPKLNYFVWLNHKRTVLGKIKVSAGELELECNSRERSERGKRLLAGAPLKHRRDEFTTQQEMRDKAKGAPQSARPRESEIPKEVRDEILTRFMEDHYRAWPDKKLPGLDGKTPREAVRNASGRELVTRILKDIENGESKKRQAGEPAYDVSRLRAELGFDN